jgi:hypothetical protein
MAWIELSINVVAVQIQGVGFVSPIFFLGGRASIPILWIGSTVAVLEATFEAEV